MRIQQIARMFAMLVIVTISFSVQGAEKLTGIVGYNVRQIGPRLEQAEKLLGQGDPKNALSYYETAKTQWDALHKDYKGKFDVNHSDIVDLQKRFDAASAKLVAAGVLKNIAPKLDARVAYALKQIDPRLDKASKLLDQGDRPNAKANYETSQQQWDAINKDFAGKFDANHPAIVAMKQKFDAVGAKLKAAGLAVMDTKLLGPPAGVNDVSGKAPPAAMAYVMKQIDENLDGASKLLDQGDRPNATASYSTAQQKWAAVLKDYAGKFDPKHSDVAATQTKFDTVGAKLKAAGLAVKDTPPVMPVSDPNAKAPPAAMLYVMKQIDASLDTTEKAVKAEQLDKAQLSFNDADEKWKSQQKWNEGKYDPKHPAVVALSTKYDRVKAALGGLAGTSSAAAASLPPVLNAIEESQKNISAAYQEARASFRDVSSLMGDFDSGRETDVNKLRAKIDELRDRAERVNSLLPNALAAAKAFRKQYPDFKKLEKLVKGGWQAGQAVQRLEEFPAIWLGDSKSLIDEALGYAEANIKQFGVNRLSAIEGSNKALQTVAADNAEQWVLSYSAYLLEVIPSILPALPEEAKSTLPEFATARQGFEKRAEPLRADIKKVAAAVAKTRKNVADAERRRLESAGFPKTNHSAGAAEADMRRAWAEAITDKKLIKLSVYRPYEVRKEARWVKDHWVVNTYRYIGANCLAQLSSGKYMVYRMNFRNTKQADGSWSELKHYSVGHVYQILDENIDK